MGLTVYNLADSTHFNIGDIITIPDPHLKQVHLDTDKVATIIDTVCCSLPSICLLSLPPSLPLQVDFSNVRCTDPRQLLLNGEKLSADKLALSVLAIKTFN